MSPVPDKSVFLVLAVVGFLAAVVLVRAARAAGGSRPESHPVPRGPGGSAWYLVTAVGLFALGILLLAARGSGRDLQEATSPDGGAWEGAAAFWLAVTGAFGLGWACFDRWWRPSPAAVPPAPAPVRSPAGPAQRPADRVRPSPVWMACGLAAGLAAFAVMLVLMKAPGAAPFAVLSLVLGLVVVGAGVVARLRGSRRQEPARPRERRADPAHGCAGWVLGGMIGLILLAMLGGFAALSGPAVFVLGSFTLLLLLIATAAVRAVARGNRVAAERSAPIFAAARLPELTPPAAPDGGDKPRRSPGPPPAPRSCPKCGAGIAADAPQGLCPKCLLAGAFASAVSPHGTAAYTGPFVAPPVEDVAEFFPQLEILGLIGQGGMGAVYKARQPALDRVVALKLIRPHDDDPTFAERFAREAKALAKLSHPNIVTVHESGTAGGSQYLLMEYVDGVTLREAMRAKSLTPAVALKVIGQVCDALQFAHGKGVVHRDIKPENILLAADGAVKIADFGLAKVVDPDGVTLTRTHQAMGTPHYMAPEQWEKPAEVDHRADIYALGVVFYELLTGELPLGRFDPPSQKVQVDVRIDEVVLRALAKEPGRRYQAVVDVRTDLDLIGRHPYRPAPAAGRPAFYEYKSKTTVLGWPLVHVVGGIDPRTGHPRTAKGWLAVGDVSAVGGVAASGVAAVGGVAVSGVMSVGVVSLTGVLAIGLLALGGLAVGGLALGGAAVGFFAVGGAAAGYFSIGGVAAGVHTLDGMNQSPEHFWQALRVFFTLPADVPKPPPLTARAGP